ncbi:MAG: SCP-2 sterol transfer family protein, partial [Gammaproteobacteria bacterium]|nr:SCP-2 sterol transfer family protein [Gammaproteobacteria bacterium]
MALFDDAWMKSFQGQWNAEPALKDALAKIEFSSVIGYGYPGDDTCQGFIDVQNGEVVEAGAYDGR